MTCLPRHKHSELLRDNLPLDGGRILDVGCGDGSLVRFLTREGARATGLECSDLQLARARAADSAGNEDYIFGVAQDLPFEDGVFDAVLFFNSLHHVPVEAQPKALDEAARVLKPGGRLYVMEPIAEGPQFELMRPIEDETYVRAKAYEALVAAGEGTLLLETSEIIYLSETRYRDFEAFKTSILAVDPARRPAFEALERDLRRHFEAVARKGDKGCFIDQPYRLNLFVRHPQNGQGKV